MTVPSVTDDLIAEIEKEAIGASGGEWFGGDEFAEYFLDAEYLALASPDNILALITRLRDSERAAEKYRHLRDGTGWPAAFASPDDPEPLRGQRLDQAITKERTE